MNIQEVSNEIATTLRNNHIDLGMSQDAIFVLGERIRSVAIPEHISIGITPKENISMEHFQSKFWKGSVEITVYSQTIFRCFEIVQMVAMVLQRQSTIALSQIKIHKIQSTAQSTTLQLIAQTIVELT